MTEKLERINTMVSKIKKQTSCLPRLCFQDTKLIPLKGIFCDGISIKTILRKQIEETLLMANKCYAEAKEDYKENLSYYDCMEHKENKDFLEKFATDDTLYELKKNKACLKILSEAYKKNNYEEFSNFLKTTHEQDGFTVHIGIEDEIEKKIEKAIPDNDDTYRLASQQDRAKIECFYGLALESLQPTNKYFWLKIASKIDELAADLHCHYNYNFGSTKNLQERLTNMSSNINELNPVDRRLRNMYDTIKRFQKIPSGLENAIGAEFKNDVFKDKASPKKYFTNSRLPIIFQ